MRILHTIIGLLFVAGLSGQNSVVLRMDPKNQAVVNVKWYGPALMNKEGFNLYKREVNAEHWEKLNSSPVLSKAFKIPASSFQADKELKEYVSIVNSSNDIKGLLLMAVLIKTFKNDDFSKYIGIRYDDQAVQSDKTYEYKVMAIKSGQEEDFAVSKPIKIESYKPIAAPQKIEHVAGNKKVSFAWEPESERYYGVDIYRKSSDSNSYRKVNKETLTISKTKDRQGNFTYGDKFFVDTKLKPRLKYTYYMVAVDFFGDASQPSDPMEITLRDYDPPMPPDSIYKTVENKTVSLKWKKKMIEDDLIGYNIYRTKSYNDTTLIKVNDEVIPVNTLNYEDHPQRFGKYLYRVASVDQDFNEGRSQEVFADVFDTEPPLQPKNVVIQADTGKLLLRWDANTEDDLAGYLVFRTINKNNFDNYVLITRDAVKTNFYTDDLPDNAKNKFLYKIVAIDESLNRSPYSEFAAARMPDILAPNAPFLKALQADDKQHVIMEWLPNAEPDLLGYHVYRKNWSDSSSGYKKLNVNPLDPKVFRYTDRNTETEVNYEYYLEAVDSSMNVSKPSNHWKYIIKEQPENMDLQFSAFKINYNEKKNQVELKWKLKTTENLKGYVVYKIKGKESTFSPISGITEETQWVDKDINKGNVYLYQVRVYNQIGDVFKSQTLKLSAKERN